MAKRLQALVDFGTREVRKDAERNATATTALGSDGYGAESLERPHFGCCSGREHATRMSACLTVVLWRCDLSSPRQSHETGRRQIGKTEENNQCLTEQLLKDELMHDRVEPIYGGEPYRFFTQDQIDAILREGAKLGRSGSHTAIDRILKHEPALERADLWKRIRQLKRPPHKPTRQRIVWSADDDALLQTGYRLGAAQKREAIRAVLRRHPDWEPSSVWKRARKLDLIPRGATCEGSGRQRRWSRAEDQKLLGLAGEMKLNTIAQRLGRSERAVACRLAWWGKRSRVHNEGYARTSLARELHMGWTTIQRLIVDGFLEVRDPRVTKESLTRLRRSDAASDEMAYKSTVSTDIRPRNSSVSVQTSSRATRIWAAVAAKLNMSPRSVEELIMRGVLKLCDSRITESSLQVFCHRYGAAINREFLSQDTREWLRSCMDFDPAAGREVARRFAASREHALRTRTCEKCGRIIRGNVFFRHIKNCKEIAAGCERAQAACAN